MGAKRPSGTSTALPGDGSGPGRPSPHHAYLPEPPARESPHDAAEGRRVRRKTPPTPRAAEPAPPSGLPPGAIQTSPGDAFNVTIYSLGGQINVDKLEVEFNRRRGIHAFYGFYRDQYEEMTTIPFSALKRIQFEGPMPVGLYDQATIGREALNLSRDYAFQVQLTYRDERREEFFALIPKLRGEKDFVLWELTMNSSVAQIDYIDFDR